MKTIEGSKGSGRLVERAQPAELVAAAWRAYDAAAALPSRVTPAAPILFFGNLDAYRASLLRVLTVGLNPSHKEFPAGALSDLRRPMAGPTQIAG